VLLVVTEGVRADRMSVYGYGRPTTPRMGSLAPEGTLFERAYTASPDDAASLASLLTGRYPPEHGLLLIRHLRDSINTLPEVLKESGYATRAITSERQMSRDSGLFQGFEEIDVVDPAAAEEFDGGAAEVSRRAISWIKEKWDRKKPFFMVLVYSSPLLPFHPPDDYRFKFVDPIVVRERVEVVSEYWLPFAEKYNAHAADLSDREMNTLRDLYDAEIFYADARIGEVVSMLREMKLLDDTLLVETATRGEDLGEQHRLADASSLREANLRIPLLIRFPGKAPAGLRVKGLAQNVDLMPTILDLLGLAHPDTISRLAVSLAPMESRTRRTDAVSTAVQSRQGGPVDLFASVRDERYRMLVGPEGPAGLFDLQSDPEGSVDILTRAAEPAARLKKALGEWDTSLSAAPGTAPLPGPIQAAPGAPAPAPKP